MIWASSSRAVGDLLLLVGRQHRARLGAGRERDRQRGEHDRAGEGQAEGQPERARRGVDAGRLADPLVGDRRERVVVELRDEQPEPAAGDDQRDRQPPARRRARHDDDEQDEPRRPGARNRAG